MSVSNRNSILLGVAIIAMCIGVSCRTAEVGRQKQNAKIRVLLEIPSEIKVGKGFYAKVIVVNAGDKPVSVAPASRFNAFCFFLNAQGQRVASWPLMLISGPALKEEALVMGPGEETSRLIRYNWVRGEKNLLHIDREGAMRLPGGSYKAYGLFSNIRGTDFESKKIDVVVMKR